MKSHKSRWERFAWWLSGKLPAMVLYFAAIRVWANATSGEYARAATTITADETIRRYEELVTARLSDNSYRARRIYAEDNHDRD